MFEKLKAAWNRLAAKSTGGEPAEAAVDYKGYRIRAAPYRTDGHYQTAGIIEKDEPEGVKQHRFVRADTHPTREAAVAFTIAKAKQIIDLQGDRIFRDQDRGGGAA
jgi:hypothetical protein